MKKSIITRNDGDNYLVRWSLLTLPWLTIKLHKILMSDDACLHDHPWSFVSLILWGGYVEHSDKGSKIYHPGNILYRPAEYKHRLEIHQPCYTLVFTTGKRREWGFWTRTGWVEWFRYRQGSNQCN